MLVFQDIGSLWYSGDICDLTKRVYLAFGNLHREVAIINTCKYQPNVDSY